MCLHDKGLQRDVFAWANGGWRVHDVNYRQCIWNLEGFSGE